MKVLLAVSGPRHHGVVRHAATVAALVEARGAVVVREGTADLTHAQFSDALWGPDIEAAVSAYERWSTTAPRPLIVTLHDVPGDDPDRRRDARRTAGYARVVAVSDGVIVSSHHEAAKAARLGPHRPQIIELPLPVAVAEVAAAPAWSDRPTLGLLGFLYPGKGHAEVIAAASRRSPAPRVVSLGAVSPGHAGLRDQLHARAAGAGVELVVTGALSDGELAAGAAAVTVPLVPGRRVSASASLLTWVSYRRRPLVAGGAYSRELDGRHPQMLELYDGDADLDRAVGRALAAPQRTYLDELPVWPDVGGQHLEAYRDLLRRAGLASAC